MGRRTPEEEYARSRCREIAKAQGSYIRKTEDRQHIFFGYCALFPEGCYIHFHGWVELLQTLETLIEKV